jgi:hypothetical protein
MGGLLFGATSLGLVLGMRHALDADHVAAVSTIVSEQRGLRGSALVGGFWGLGHALALLLAGGALLAWRVQGSWRSGVRRAACGCTRTGTRTTAASTSTSTRTARASRTLRTRTTTATRSASVRGRCSWACCTASRAARRRRCW